MTSTNKGGRPFAPRSKAEVIERISCESIGKARPERLRVLYRLLAAFERSEREQREDARTAAIAESNRLHAQELAQKKADYLLRFVSRPLGQRMLLAKVERLEKEITQLKMLHADRGACAA
jgi:hypothetical protein